jgi:hypothetical protein
MNVNVLMGQLAPFQNRHEMLESDQSTGDIIQAILDAHKKHAGDYAKISSFFNAGSTRDTARKIFNFLKGNVKYIIEPGSRQTVKSPSAILAQGYGDCKHYSLFAGGILQNLGIPFNYRFASYRVFNKEPQHVFVVVNPGTKNEIWIDPVLNKFDYKKAYTYATDRKPMALYSISGVGATAQQKAALKAAKAARKSAPTKAAKKAAVTEVKAARKAAGRTAGQVLKKGAKAVLKVAAAPVRNAFLALVALNFGGLGNKLAAAWQKAPSKVTNFWEGVGGKLQALKSAWEKGSKKKRIFGDDSYIGVAPAAATATAAAPLLVKVANVLRDIGIDPAELVQLGKDALNAKAQELAKKALEPKAATEAANIDTADQVFDENSAPSMEITQTPAFTEKVATGKPNFLPLILGGAAVLYFVTRK